MYKILTLRVLLLCVVVPGMLARGGGVATQRKRRRGEASRAVEEAPHAAVAEVMKLARRKMWGEADDRLREMEKEGFPRDPGLCTIAVNTCARLRQPQRAALYLRLTTPAG